MNELIRTMLSRRGIDEERLSEIEDASHPVLAGTKDAIRRMKEAHDRGETITVLPDFDMDGIMSGVVGIAGLSVLGFNAELFVPNPKEGYGFDAKTIDRLFDEHPLTSVIITCDTGISCRSGVKRAVELGFDVIVTDHHVETEETSPRDLAVSIVDPCAIGEQYPHKGICGAHVLWQVLDSYAREFCDENTIEKISLLRVFAGIGTVSDTMPMLYENRKLVRDSINECRSIMRLEPWIISMMNDDNEYCNAFRGLWGALVRTPKAPDAKDLHEDFFGFYLAPEFNAVKRMDGDMNHAFSMFMTGKPGKDMRYLVSLNEQRKREVESGIKELSRTEDKDPFSPWCRVSSSRPGVLGLLATKLMDGSGPHIVVRKDGDGYKGSGRSEEWYPFLTRTSSIQGVHVAGHEGAFGFRADNREAMMSLKKFLDEDVPPLMPESDGSPSYDILVSPYNGDIGYEPEELLEFADSIDDLRPFGRGFEEPVVMIVLDPDSDDVEMRIIGSEKTHLKISINGIDVMCWNQADIGRRIMSANDHDRTIGVIGKASVNEFRGNRTPQIMGNVLMTQDGENIEYDAKRYSAGK